VGCSLSTSRRPDDDNAAREPRPSRGPGLVGVPHATRGARRLSAKKNPTGGDRCKLDRPGAGRRLSQRTAPVTGLSRPPPMAGIDSRRWQIGTPSRSRPLCPNNELGRRLAGAGWRPMSGRKSKTRPANFPRCGLARVGQGVQRAHLAAKNPAAEATEPGPPQNRLTHAQAQATLQ